jgi:hypothetical protein
VIQNGELQHVSLGNVMLAKSHVPIMPVGPPWDHSSPDDLMNMIIKFIIFIVVVIHFLKGKPLVRLWLFYVHIRRGSRTCEILILAPSVFFSAGTGNRTSPPIFYVEK